jgi:NADP-dependent 3-hydroxy acid dehydrogenase YdfG
MDVMDLTGAVVIVTGASSGIGAAAARLLTDAGAHPVLAARRADRLGALSRELGGVLAVPTDVTDRKAVRQLVQLTLDRYGRVDGLVNNAGVSLHESLDTLDLDEFCRVLDLNVVSVVAMTQAVLPAMRARGSGRIVNISSGTTRLAMPGVGAYAATKSAVNMLTSVARKELEGDGIAVSLVLPSITATEFAGGRFQPGQQLRAGMVAHSPGYVGSVILRALRTGEERIDIPPGPEQPELTQIPPG